MFLSMNGNSYIGSKTSLCNEQAATWVVLCLALFCMEITSLIPGHWPSELHTSWSEINLKAELVAAS